MIRSPNLGKGRVALPNRMNFRKSSKGGGEGRAFLIKNIILQILDLYKRLFSDVFRKKLRYSFPKMRGGEGLGFLNCL